MKNILITGGAGFIGSNLALALKEKGHKVTVLDNLSRQIHGDDPVKTSSLYLSIRDKVDFVFGSVTDRAILEKVVQGQDIIVHLAAETGTGQSMYQIEHYSSTNIGGTALLLDILANKKCATKKVVVASSRAIYGEGKYLNGKGIAVYPKHRVSKDMDRGDFGVSYNGDKELTLVATDEESKIHPASVYGITKQVQEQLVMTVCPTLGISPVALRYQNVYGPGQSLSNPYTGILSIFSTQILNGNSLNIFEDGMESRDFVFIDDVVEATICAIELESANGEVFNIGSGTATTVHAVATKLVELYKKDVSISITGNYRLGDIRHNFAELSKSKKMLNFTPKVPFARGIELFAKWVQQQGIKEDRYEHTIAEMRSKGLLK